MYFKPILSNLLLYKASNKAKGLLQMFMWFTNNKGGSTLLKRQDFYFSGQWNAHYKEYGQPHMHNTGYCHLLTYIHQYRLCDDHKDTGALANKNEHVWPLKSCYCLNSRALISNRYGCLSVGEYKKVWKNIPCRHWKEISKPGSPNGWFVTACDFYATMLFISHVSFDEIKSVCSRLPSNAFLTNELSAPGTQRNPSCFMVSKETMSLDHVFAGNVTNV